MLKNLECIYCNTKFSVKIHANFSVICPCCKRSIYLECEYGFGSVTPCQIYLGEEIIGIVESNAAHYYLNTKTKRINLNKTYLKAIPEAEEVLKEQLNIFRPNKNIGIITQGGSLCFFGDWFGRPHDNFHKIVQTNYDGEILEIKFDHWEHLIIYEPENITSEKNELTIAKAKKIKWMYIPYGSKTTEYTTILYASECGNISKETKYGVEHLTIKEPFWAVYLG